MTFWLGIVLILLSSVGSQPVPKSQISTSDVLAAARDVVADITHFCERQPQACTVGSKTTVTLVERAQAGAKILYEFLGHQFGSNGSGSVTTEGVAIQPASQQTVGPADLLPPARSLKVVPITAPVHSDVEIETAINALRREPGVMPVTAADPENGSYLVARAGRHALAWQSM
jgi:hypothetical protein